MKFLLINGSPKANGNTAFALKVVAETLNEKGIETETVQVGNKAIRGCIACTSCYKTGKCAFDDEVNAVAPKFEEAAGLIVASPVYYASANGTLVSFLDRLFYSTHFDKTMKIGAAIAVARRGGTTSTYDELNKYFAISGMPIATSNYWNILHGRVPGEAEKDEEGVQTVRVLAENAAYLAKAIEEYKKVVPAPERPIKKTTNFIR